MIQVSFLTSRRPPFEVQRSEEKSHDFRDKARPGGDPTKRKGSPPGSLTSWVKYKGTGEN